MIFNVLQKYIYIYIASRNAIRRTTLVLPYRWMIDRNDRFQEERIEQFNRPIKTRVLTELIIVGSTARCISAYITDVEGERVGRAR